MAPLFPARLDTTGNNSSNDNSRTVPSKSSSGIKNFLWSIWSRFSTPPLRNEQLGQTTAIDNEATRQQELSPKNRKRKRSGEFRSGDNDVLESAHPNTDKHSSADSYRRKPKHKKRRKRYERSKKGVFINPSSASESECSDSFDILESTARQMTREKAEIVDPETSIQLQEAVINEMIDEEKSYRHSTVLKASDYVCHETLQTQISQENPSTNTAIQMKADVHSPQFEVYVVPSESESQGPQDGPVSIQGSRVVGYTPESPTDESNKGMKNQKSDIDAWSPSGKALTRIGSANEHTSLTSRANQSFENSSVINYFRQSTRDFEEYESPAPVKQIGGSEFIYGNTQNTSSSTPTKVGLSWDGQNGAVQNEHCEKLFCSTDESSDELDSSNINFKMQELAADSTSTKFKIENKEISREIRTPQIVPNKGRVPAMSTPDKNKGIGVYCFTYAGSSNPSQGSTFVRDVNTRPDEHNSFHLHSSTNEVGAHSSCSQREPERQAPTSMSLLDQMKLKYEQAGKSFKGFGH